MGRLRFHSNGITLLAQSHPVIYPVSPPERIYQLIVIISYQDIISS
ncbi:uncharacterized protein METZ01_LOCUS369411 [marine metagenome]|uniref:Uncharacterized protein n=1 Tax=marine metagenome TaxID=408172 RepID=A0A382T4Z9_9ZZZZ